MANIIIIELKIFKRGIIILLTKILIFWEIVVIDSLDLLSE